MIREDRSGAHPHKKSRDWRDRREDGKEELFSLDGKGGKEKSYAETIVYT